MKHQNDTLRTVKLVDVLPDLNVQMVQARKILGAEATDADIKDLAEARVERAKDLRQKFEIPLGTVDLPFPMWVTRRTDNKGTIDFSEDLSAIAGDPLAPSDSPGGKPMMIYSERNYDDVMALAYCDMPVPSMLQLFYQGLERRKPESFNRTQMMIGDPGHGKSFLGAHQGRLREKGSIEVFDCGGKNMNELLFEMVLDFGSGDALPHAIDKRLKAGAMQELTLAHLEKLNELEEMPPEVQDNEDDRARWIASTTIVTKTSDGRFVVDWKKLRTGSHEKISKAHEILTKISHIEGLDKAGGNALGMNSQYGPLIRAFLEGREIVLDEYNKSREGTDNALQTVWQFLIGEIQTCTVDNPLKNKDLSAGPSSFTFSRDDISLGFFATLTGNKTEDGITTRSLNKSVYSRLSPETLPDPTVLDWQHRICQMLVGVPVSTLYNTFADQADASPDEFGGWLLSLRRQKAKIEGMPVPAWQETLLSNWQNVVAASEILAKFYDAWSKMTNADKLAENSLTDLVQEVDPEYSKKEGVDFRKIKQHFEWAIPVRPRPVSAGTTLEVNFKKAFTRPKVARDVEEENLSLHLGTRFIEFLEGLVYSKTEAVGKHLLFKKMAEIMHDTGFRDIDLKEGAKSGKKSLEDLLNISSFADPDLSKQAKLAQKVLCNYLRQVDPEIAADNDEHIVTAKKIRDALAAVAATTSQSEKVFFVPNRDHETLSATPFISARLEDEATYEISDDVQEVSFSGEDLVSHDDFLASLAMPTVANQNVASLWESNLSPAMAKNETSSSAETVAESVTQSGSAFDMAQNKSSLGLAITTVCVMRGGALTSVHVVRDEIRKKTLVVSEKVPSKLLSAFQEAGIVHVDRSDSSAKEKLDAALGDMVRQARRLALDKGLVEFKSGEDPEAKAHDMVMQRLAQAFDFRNEVAPAQRDPALADRLIDGTIEMSKPKYIVKNKPAGK